MSGRWYYVRSNTSRLAKALALAYVATALAGAIAIGGAVVHILRHLFDVGWNAIP